MRLRWGDVDMTTTPGRVPYLDGELVIERKHIAVWSEHPEAIYQITLGGHFHGRKLYTLGGWTLPTD
jgi:hypothetical protein